jgi:integral membrane protein (TIGR01906 family)
MTAQPADRTMAERLAAFATGVAASVLLIGIAVLPFLSPAWVHFEQDRTGAAELTGFTTAQLRTATDSILSDLVVGPPRFDVEVAGSPVLEERERAHMRDVRGVFAAFAGLVVVAAVVLVALLAGARRMGHPERGWSAIERATRWLIGGIVVAGVVASVAFDAVFEIFHRLFFPGGSYTFDPRTDRLVQLFPFEFWSETTIAVGAVIIVLALAVSVVSARRTRGVTQTGAAAGRVAATAGRETVG